jgi:integrase
MSKKPLTSPELLAQVNPENLALKDEFILYMQSEQKSEGTIKGYCNDLDIFFVWLLQNANNKYFVDIDRRDIIRFQSFLVKEGKSSSRIRRVKATLSSLSNYIENIYEDEYPNFRNIINKVKDPVLNPVKEKTVLTDEDVEKLLSTLVQQEKYMQACFVALAAYCGARKSELLRFKVDYFDEENIIFGALYKTPEKIKTKGMGGGKMLHKYVLVHPFKPYLDLWLKEREKLGINSPWLFVTKRGNKWERTKTYAVDYWMKSFSDIIGKNVYPHAFRHYMCTYYAKSNLPDTVIQEIFGWSSVEMVKIYKDLGLDEQLEKFFDEDGIKKVESTRLSDL